MARKRTIEAADDGTGTLPLALVRRPVSAAEAREQSRKVAAWFRAHGVDPGDWSQVGPILLASRRHHRRDPAHRELVEPDALERARQRVEPGGP